MSLELFLSQKQVLSQRMQLSVKILQMNSYDLEQYINDSAIENPLIDIEKLQQADDAEIIRPKKVELHSSIDESDAYAYAYGRKTDYIEYELPINERYMAKSLADTLLMQLPGFRLPEQVEQRVRYLIDCLDENGYIAIPRNQLMRNLSINDAQFHTAIGILHRMDPPGVGATDLRECLLIQAKRNPKTSPILILLIENYLDALAKNQIEKIAKALRVPLDDVKYARTQLLELNPKPGNGYSSYNSIPYIQPDLFVMRSENGFQIVFNDYYQPKIEISSYYCALEKDIDINAANYLKENLDKAKWLMNCVRQRKDTIMRCGGSILSHQINYFERGPGNLLPMTLADVAEDLGLHPSTISRAINGKYLQCQWGTIGLIEFFSHGVGGKAVDSGIVMSQDMIMTQIRRIIAKENPSKPYSDQEIMMQLQNHGISAARRTVSKYREQQGIPSSGRRKKY